VDAVSPLAPLAPGQTLRVTDAQGAVVFESQGRWLHPLFDLADYLKGHPSVDPSGLRVRDRVVGRAAAFLLVRMGVRTLETDVISLRAQDILAGAGTRWAAGTEVDRIGCQTEDLLAEVTDSAAAWTILVERRAKALAGR
jgi:hypothetical protein